MVEIIPKEPKRVSRRIASLFYFVLFLLFFTMVSYFVLNAVLKNSKEQLAVLELDLAKVMSSEEIALEKEILAAKDQVDKFSLLIGRHLISSRVFEPTQNTIHPQVWLKTFNFASRQGELKISGETESFVTLWQQVLIFREEPALKKVDLVNFSINEKGRVNFEMFLYLNPEIFTN